MASLYLKSKYETASYTRRHGRVVGEKRRNIFIKHPQDFGYFVSSSESGNNKSSQISGTSKVGVVLFVGSGWWFVGPHSGLEG